MTRIRQVNVRLTPEEYSYVRYQAKKRRVTIAVYLRECLTTAGLLREGELEELPNHVKAALNVWHLEQHQGETGGHA